MPSLLRAASGALCSAMNCSISSVSWRFRVGSSSTCWRGRRFAASALVRGDPLQVRNQVDAQLQLRAAADRARVHDALGARIEVGLDARDVLGLAAEQVDELALQRARGAAGDARIEQAEARSRRLARQFLRRARQDRAVHRDHGAARRAREHPCAPRSTART
jgi:hypothetical protein